MSTQPLFETLDTMSQEQAVLQYLQSGRTLTPLEALDMYKCLRLGARIRDLRKAGHNIESEMVKVPSGKRVASYRLVNP